MKKTKYIKNLMIGEPVENEVFCLKEVTEYKQDNISIVLSDSSGVISASVSKSAVAELDLKELTEHAILVSGVILSEGTKPLFRVKQAAPATDFIPAEVFGGLSSEKIKEFTDDIKFLKEKVTHAGYKALLDACLTDENLSLLARRPATINYYGRYQGGALAATDCVARMVMSCMSSYTKRGNGISSMPPAWNALITASLLFCYGRIKFYTDTFPPKKSQMGVSLGYFSTLQSMIQDAVRLNNISLTDKELSNLLNILNVSVSSKTEASAVSKDGPVLRHMISLYAECDSMDWAHATHDAPPEEDGYYFDAKLKRYIVDVE